MFKKQISIAQLCAWVGLIVAGFSLTFLFKSGITLADTTLSPYDFIGFVLSVFLSGSSIILAITAINLGKSSEQAVITRSDESIRLQNDVFVKTTEALARIESSTGVTEKRIEDIIAGRVTEASQQAAEVVSGTSSGNAIDPKKLEESIRKSLMESFSGRLITRSTNDEEYEKARTKQREDLKSIRLAREEREKIYEEVHQSFLLSIGNMDGVDILKVSHGAPDKENDGLFDGIYEKNSNKFTASTFRNSKTLPYINQFISNACIQIESGAIKHVIIGLFENKDEAVYLDKVTEIIELLRPELKDKFSCISFNPEKLEALKPQIKEIVDDITE